MVIEMDFDGQKILNVDIEKEMKESYLAYSMSVIVSRALPDVRDGLKPVNRRILYTLFENGLTSDKPYRKCADTVGSVLGRYHPHGDASVYDAMVRMAQSFSLRYPLIDGHGNFGSIDGDGAAAYRYTESRMSKIASHMLTDIEKETVSFIPNYDDRLKEPAVLPAKYPNLLVNGTTGIAVGMATNIPPHNLTEVINGMCALIDNPDATLEDLMEYIHGPDFPTGGIIMGRSGIRAAYATGRGKITLRGRAEIEEMKNGRMRIVITEIPYMVNKARMVEHIAELVKDKRIEGISDLRDESGRDGMRIVVELKREANAQVILNQLYSYSQLQDTVGVNMLALDHDVPKVFTLKEMLERYIDHQVEVITRRTQFDLRKAKERVHILEGLKTALDFIDEVIEILRASKSIPEGKAALIERFGLDDVQAQAIVQMRLGQLTGLEREKIEDEIDGLHAKIAEFEAILADRAKVLAIVKEEAIAIRDKYGDERRTEIAMVSGEVDIEDLIPKEDCVITMTQAGYIKRQTTDTYKSQRRGGRGITGITTREEDFATDMFVASTHDFVMFFTNTGRVYRLKCYEVPEGSRTSRGMNIANLLPIGPDEKITSMIKVPEFAEGMYLVMVTKHGIIKRTALSEYDTARKTGVRGLVLAEGDALAWVRLTGGHNELLVATRNGMGIRFAETDARELGRVSQGVRAIRLQEGDEVVGMSVVREDATVLTVTAHGQGRRTPLSEYKVQTRGGKGSTNYKCIDDAVCGIKIVDEDDDIILISSDGIIIRMPAAQIAVQSRYAKGVRVMRVEEGSEVVSLARAPHEEDEPDDLIETEDGGKDSAPEGENADAAQAAADDASQAQVVTGMEAALQAANTPIPELEEEKPEGGEENKDE